MKYLNKIVFINSADRSLPYAEVSLDGNVHLIGTQGVGKSTLLRAILFFYNADKTKLGVPREKKTFDDYYLPYQNSYLIYEVQTGNNLYCVMAFKTQGRTAFRFVDAAYDKLFFIDKEGNAFDSWEKTREVFGRHINYTRIIQGYEEYRNIIYGNNKGLPAEFRKYAILESRQYQNIPRTITNVFLNASLSAEFVKETIIKSLNEDEITIDLTTYSQSHLRDFETHVNDIKKWTEKNRNSESVVEKQALKVCERYASFNYLEKHKTTLAAQLGYALQDTKDQLPAAKETLAAEEARFAKRKQKQQELNDVYNKKKEKVQGQIAICKNRLDEIKNKRSEYAVLQIESLIERVAQKGKLDWEKNNLVQQRQVLTNAFLEVEQRYDALYKQLQNSLQEFENNKQKESNIAVESYLHYKDELNRQYEDIYENTRNRHREETDVARALAKEKAQAVANARIKQSEIKGKPFYEAEISHCSMDISGHQSAITESDYAVRQAKDRQQTLTRQWELEDEKIQAEVKRKEEKQHERLQKQTDELKRIEAKMESSKDSLYGWLNENAAGWDATIGKVIDEENVLFQAGLNPEKTESDSASFYGIKIDTSRIGKEVKTIDDYRKEKESINNSIQATYKLITDINAACADDVEKLMRRFLPKIKEQKDTIQNAEYATQQSRNKLDELRVQLGEWKEKAVAEKKAALADIAAQIEQLGEEERDAAEQVRKIESSIAKQMETKRKEKEARLKTEQQTRDAAIAKLNADIEQEKEEKARKQAALRSDYNEELHQKGADTKQVAGIDMRLSEIETELYFIENNRDTVAGFYKDKRELLDKEDEWKNEKTTLEKQLATEQQKHAQQRDSLTAEIQEITSAIDAVKRSIAQYDADLEAFDQFAKSEIYTSVAPHIDGYTDSDKTGIRASQLITELERKHYESISRCNDLQEAVNKFAGNFSENNIFRFSVKYTERADYLVFAASLKEFMEQDKIGEYKKRVEERFAHIIRQIGKETGELIAKEGEIHGIISDINSDFEERNFVGAIRSMKLRTVPSANRIFQLLVAIKRFNDENAMFLGAPNLFSGGDAAGRNEKAIDYLKQLVKEISAAKETEISLSDSFELEFRIVENDNDTEWVSRLSHVGSEGTDVLVKAMINIMLLNVFKDRAAKQGKGNFWLHCMLDEIGKQHPNNVKGILKFANDRNIFLINGSPTSYNATDYRYTYLLTKDAKHITRATRLVRKLTKPETTEAG